MQRLQLFRGLEGVFERNDEWVSNRSEHPSLRLGVHDLVAVSNVFLSQHLHRVDDAAVRFPNEHYLQHTI